MDIWSVRMENIGKDIQPTEDLIQAEAGPDIVEQYTPEKAESEEVMEVSQDRGTPMERMEP